MGRRGVLTERMEAERALLGAILQSPQLAYTDGASEDLFANPAHRRIFSAITQSSSPDLVSVTDYLARTDQLGACGGAAYISELCSSVPRLSSVRHYVAILSEAAYRRRVLRAAQEAIARAQTDPDVESVAQAAANLEISSAARRGALVLSGKDLVRQEVEDFRIRSQAKVMIAETGIRDLDEHIRMSRKGVWFIGARPAVGKTSFLMQTSLHNAKKQRKTLFLGFEMGTKRLTWRAIANLANAPLRNIQAARFAGQTQNLRVLDSLEWLEKTENFVLAYDPSPTLSSIRQIVKTARAKMGGLDLVVMDYFQLIKGSGKRTLYEERTEAVRGLVAMAGEDDVVLVCGCQLNREADTIQERDRPKLSELKGTGSLEEEATGVILIHRWDLYRGGRFRDVELILAKNQDGPTCLVRLVFDVCTGRYLEAAPAEEEQ